MKKRIALIIGLISMIAGCTVVKIQHRIETPDGVYVIEVPVCVWD